MSSRENHETLATGFVRDLQAGIMPEAVVWGCLRLPMMLVMVVFLGAAGWLLSGYAQGNRKTEAEYLSSPVAIETGVVNFQTSGLPCREGSNGLVP